MEGAMICSRCQTPYDEGDKYCEQCGAPLSDEHGTGVAADDGTMGATVLAGPAAPAALVRLTAFGGESHQLGSRAVVGRLESCDIPVSDKSVSREHARLSRLRDGYVIEDLGSTNGTMVNGQRINEAVLLRPGDLVTIGSVEFRYEHSKQEAAETAPTDLATTIVASAPDRRRQAELPGEEVGVPAMVGHEEARTMYDQPASDEPPTIPDVQDGPFDFPPLEPFGPSHGVEVPPRQPTARMEQRNVQVEATGGAEPAAQPGDIAPTTISTTPPEAPAAIEPEGTPRSTSEEQHMTMSPAADTADLDNEAISDLGNEAFATVRRVGDLIDKMFKRLGDSEATARHLRDQVAALEAANERQGGLRSVLQEAPEPSLDGERLHSVQAMLDTLIQSPRDVEVLMHLGQQAANLAAVVNECTQLRRVLDKIGGELEVQSQES